MSGIHLRERNLIFVIKNLILVNITEKSQKKLDLKAKGMGGVGMGGCDKGRNKNHDATQTTQTSSYQEWKKGQQKGENTGFEFGLSSCWVRNTSS